MPTVVLSDLLARGPPSSRSIRTSRGSPELPYPFAGVPERRPHRRLGCCRSPRLRGSPVWGALGHAYLVLAFQQAAVTERASYGQQSHRAPPGSGQAANWRVRPCCHYMSRRFIADCRTCLATAGRASRLPDLPRDWPTRLASAGLASRLADSPRVCRTRLATGPTRLATGPTRLATGRLASRLPRPSTWRLQALR
jgi:hypothetical protein